VRLVPLLLLLATTVAHADDEDDAFQPVPKRSVAIAVLGHATHIGDRAEGGIGPALELGLGRGRWMYFVEGALASVSVGDAQMPMQLNGRMLHGGIGVRWLARQLRDSNKVGGLELFLQSIAGVQRFYFNDGTRLLRPELAVGFGMQARAFRRPRLAVRFDLRALVASGNDTGFMGGIGVAW